jgi:hypothetical protein
MTMTKEDWQDRYHEAEARHREFIAMSGEEHRQAIAKLEAERDKEKARAERLLDWKGEVDSHLIACGRATPITFENHKCALYALVQAAREGLL